MALKEFLNDEAAHRMTDQDRFLTQPVDDRRDIVDVIGDRMPVDVLTPVATPVSTQRKRMTGEARRGQERHEGIGPHPAAGECAVDEK